MMDFIAGQLLPNLFWLFFTCAIAAIVIDAFMPFGRKDK